MTDHLTVSEVAAELRVDETTVRRHIRKGDLRASKPFGVVRVTRADLDAYLEASVIRPQRPREQAPAAATPRQLRPTPSPAASVRDRLRADRKRAA